MVHLGFAGRAFCCVFVWPPLLYFLFFPFGFCCGFAAADCRIPDRLFCCAITATASKARCFLSCRFLLVTSPPLPLGLGVLSLFVPQLHCNLQLHCHCHCNYDCTVTVTVTVTALQLSCCCCSCLVPVTAAQAGSLVLVLFLFLSVCAVATSKKL